MGETRYVNSSALAVLVKFAETFRERGGGIALARVSPRVKLVFEMLGLLVFFKFFDSSRRPRRASPPGRRVRLCPETRSVFRRVGARVRARTALLQPEPDRELRHTGPLLRSLGYGSAPHHERGLVRPL